MATRGFESWYKHFSCLNSNTVTKTRHHSLIYDIEHEHKKIASVEKYYPIEYIVTNYNDGYTHKPVVALMSNNFVCRTSFSNIAKPNSRYSQSIKLTPKALGLCGTYKKKDYTEHVVHSIQNNDHYVPELKRYLISLTRKNFVEDYYISIKEHVPPSIIANEFSEVLAPLYVDGDDITFPESENEPLIDFRVDDILFSVKTNKSRTNVIKPRYLIDYADKETIEYHVLKILSENSMRLGPIRAAALLYEELYKFKDTSTEDLDDPYYFRDFANANAYLSSLGRLPSLNEIVFEFEYLITLAGIENKLDFNKIFLRSVSNKITYVKSRLSSCGALCLTFYDDPAGLNIRIRSKNTRNRISDKMGLQI